MLFNNFYYGMPENHPMNVKESEGAWEVEFRATGLTKEDVQIEYKGEDVLWIKAGDREKERKKSITDMNSGKTILILDSNYLPELTTRLKQKVENGILYITIPKE